MYQGSTPTVMAVSVSVPVCVLVLLLVVLALVVRKVRQVLCPYLSDDSLQYLGTES